MYFVIKFSVKCRQNPVHGTENCWLKSQQQFRIHRSTGTIFSPAWNVTGATLDQQKIVKTESINVVIVDWVADWLVWQLFKKQWFDINNICLWSICTQSGCVRAGGRDPRCPSVCCYCNCAGNLLLQSQDEGRTGVSAVSLLWSPGTLGTQNKIITKKSQDEKTIHQIYIKCVEHILLVLQRHLKALEG